MCDLGFGFTEAKRNVDVVQRAADHWGLSLPEILKPAAGTSMLWHREQFINPAPAWGALIRAYNRDDLLAARSVAHWLLDQLYIELKGTKQHSSIEAAQ
jgi:hypothetical protein